ncbi:hypothetical protein BaRGS_00039915 [Batillaria attramentaria]|uniref:Uncharacterized protein n=1 Tax=Batillaria attramentaria TaxID=370345 RepID=A0ABD0J1X7_9CAEN
MASGLVLSREMARKFLRDLAASIFYTSATFLFGKQSSPLVLIGGESRWCELDNNQLDVNTSRVSWS